MYGCMCCIIGGSEALRWLDLSLLWLQCSTSASCSPRYILEGEVLAFSLQFEKTSTISCNAILRGNGTPTLFSVAVVETGRRVGIAQRHLAGEWCAVGLCQSTLVCWQRVSVSTRILVCVPSGLGLKLCDRPCSDFENMWHFWSTLLFVRLFRWYLWRQPFPPMLLQQGLLGGMWAVFVERTAGVCAVSPGLFC
jgi:hypothetical protein